MSEVGASHVDEKLGLHIVPKTKVCYKLDSLAFIKLCDGLFECYK